MSPEPLASLAKTYPTPFYAYEIGEVEARVSELRQALPDGARLYYSLKANPLPPLIQQVREQGCFAEITSLGELDAAMTAGWKCADLLMGGPGKSAADLTKAIQRGVRFFSAESLVDLGRLQSVSAQLGVTVPTLIRINPAHPPEARLAMSGVESQFGIEESQWTQPGFFDSSLYPNLEICGVHIYFGTQIASSAALLVNLQRALDCAERIATTSSIQLRLVNVGGGFPWAYAREAEPMDWGLFHASASEIWKSSHAANCGATLCFESGRFISASSGSLVATVLDKKKVGSRTFIVLDTGIHHLGGMSGLGRVARSALTVCLLSQPSKDALLEVDLTGPLCTPLDCLARGLLLPDLQVGDHVSIPNVGAYGLTASLNSFLSHPPPLEITHRNGEVVSVCQLRHGHEIKTLF